MLFVWDEAKAETNFRKHGVRFEEAALVFGDPHHLGPPRHAMGKEAL